MPSCLFVASSLTVWGAGCGKEPAGAGGGAGMTATICFAVKNLREPLPNPKKAQKGLRDSQKGCGTRSPACGSHKSVAGLVK